MTTLSLTLALILGGCFGSSNESTPEPNAKPPEQTEQQATKKGPAGKAKKEHAAEGKAKDKAKAKAKAKAKDRAPVIRTGRFRVPLKSLEDADMTAIQAAVLGAWEKTGGAKSGEGASAEGEAQKPAPDNSEFPKAWKCRRATVWEVSGDDAASKADVRLFERLPDANCAQGDDKLERWELSLRYALSDKPAGRDGGGEFRYLMSGLDLDYADKAWTESFSHIFRKDSGKEESGFTHDDAWLGEQLPEGLSLTGKKARLDSERWAIAKINVANELLTVEVERWKCHDGGAFAGAELVFRTNKRQAGHTTTAPKDVLVTDKIKTFGLAVAEALGDRVGGEGNETSGALTCAKP